MVQLLDGQLAVDQGSFEGLGFCWEGKANDGNLDPREHAWSTGVALVQQSCWHSVRMFRHFFL
jgi:hypothetical protein